MRFMRLRYFFGAAAVVIGVWWFLRPAEWMNWLGFSHDAYFKTGQNYAFFSGVGPCLLTAVGLSTIISTMLRHVNCHVDGCPRITRHKIANGEYGVCSKHWREVNGHEPDHKYTVAHLREHHHAHLRATGRRGHGEPGGPSGFAGTSGGGGGGWYGGGGGAGGARVFAGDRINVVGGGGGSSRA